MRKNALSVQAISKKPWQEYMTKDEKIIYNNVKKNKNNEIKSKCKIKRNDEYFWHLESYDSMKAHILNLSFENWLILSEKELIEITNNTLDVKFADRIHNLSTQWDPNDLETVRRKIEETKKYFLSIAKEISKEAFEKLKNEILILEIKLNNTSWKVWELI